jgi:putative membrane protein
MPAVKIFFIILFSIIVAVFAVKNMNSVEISYYDFQLNSHVLKVPLLIVVVCSMSLGFAIAWMGSFFQGMKLNSKVRKLSKSNHVLSQELDQLKAEPPKQLTEKIE